MFSHFILLLLSTIAGLANSEIQEFDGKVKTTDTDFVMETYHKNDSSDNNAEENIKDVSSDVILNISCTCTLHMDVEILAYYGSKIFKNGDHVLSGTEINFLCRSSAYRLNGITTAACQPNCSWNPPELPSCLPLQVNQCESPKNPVNGVALYAEQTHGSKLTYKCHEGYQLSHLQKRMCGADGKWNGTEPVCKVVTCENPRDPDNGRALYTSLEYNSELTYECDNGKRPSSNQIRRCGSDGKWTGVEPSCDGIRETRECGEPPKYDKAKIKDSSLEPYQLGSKITYICEQGFITGGGIRKQSTCTEDPETKMLQWTKVEIVCSPKSCGHPGDVMNAQKIGARFTFPNNVTYVCDAGYKMTGSPRRFCLASATWSGTLPTCNKISCQRPRDPENGVAQYDSLEYDSVLTYQCNKGFELSSSVKRICGLDEKWTGDEPICEEVECETPDKPEYGSVEVAGGKARVGSIAIFKCEIGRKLIGSGTSRCLKTGEWSFETPRCIEPCIILNIPNGQLGKYEDVYHRWSRSWKREFKQVSARTTIDEGDKLVQKCDKKYKPKGQSGRGERNVTCLDGKLSPPPECVIETCIIPDIPNGQLGKYDIVQGPWTRSRKPGFRQVLANTVIEEEDEVVLKCDRNYKPTRQTRIPELNVTCLSGKLSPTPECEIKPCIIPYILNGQLKLRENAQYSGSQNSENREDSAITAIDERDEVILECNADYKPKGQSGRQKFKITCQNGKLLPTPECVTTRCRRESLAHEGLIEEEFVFLRDDESFTPRCEAGYRVSRDHNAEVSCREGEWTGNIPPCTKVLCNTSDLRTYNGVDLEAHGSVEAGYEIEPKCADGYELRNKSYPKILCHQGQWTGNLPPCVSGSCHDSPPTIPNGKAEVTSTQAGHTIWYKCDNHFKVTKKGNVTCVSGSWTGNPPVCEDTRCYKESLNYPGLINVFDSPVSNEWSFMPECETGFHVTPKEDEKIHCRTGKWIGNLPPCTINGCNTEDLLKLNGLMLSDHRAILNDGERIQPKCNEGFELNNKNSDSWIYCREEDWTGNLPPCSPAMCSTDPPVLENGRIKSLHAGHGGTAEYECFEFYELITKEKVVCRYGNWNGSLICKDTRCYVKDLPQKEGVDLALNVPTHSKKTADISCIAGYRLRNSNIFCERGEWRIPNEQSPCEEDDCEVVPIENGKIFKETTEPRIKIFSFKLGKETYLKEATIGSSESSGAILYVKCKEEENDDYLLITCRRGQWTPLSVCGTRSCSVGTGAPELSETTREMSSTDGVTNTSTDDLLAITDSPGNGSLHNSPPTNIELEVTSTDTISVCSCTYITLDSVLVGYDGNRKLAFNDEVKSGSTVVFHCNEPGHFDLRGNKNMTCPPGCYWHSSWFPSCYLRKGKDVIITVRAKPKENLVILAGGVYAVNSGTTLDIECQIFDGSMTHVEWKIPQTDGGYVREGGCLDRRQDCYHLALEGRCDYQKDWMTRHCRRSCSACNSDYPFKGIYTIDHVSSLSTGKFTCTDQRRLSDHNFLHSITIEVKDAQCPEITETEQLIVTYERNRRWNTKAHFLCREPYIRLGPSYITCEPPGQWSALLPTCKHDMQCPEIVETQKLIVTYERNRNVGTKAHFSCQKPYTKYGLDNITCESSGQWSAPAAHCRYIQCPEITAEKPLIVTFSDKRNVNSTVSFHCPIPYKRNGLSHAICGPSGKWSGPTPSCHMSTCSLTEVYDALPKGVENIVPYTQGINEEHLPYGYSLNLHCDEKGRVFEGNSTAVCNEKGKWTVDKNVQCVKGCARVQKRKDSQLQISPDKETYEIGELVTFACPQGMTLAQDVERILCFNNGWTPDVTPDCQ